MQTQRVAHAITQLSWDTHESPSRVRIKQFQRYPLQLTHLPQADIEFRVAKSHPDRGRKVVKTDD